QLVETMSVARGSPYRAPVSPAASVRSLLLSRRFLLPVGLRARWGRLEEGDPHAGIVRGTPAVASEERRRPRHRKRRGNVRALELDQVSDVPAQRGRKVAAGSRLSVMTIRPGLVIRTEVVVHGRDHELGQDGPPGRLPLGAPPLANALAEDRTEVGPDEH